MMYNISPAVMDLVPITERSVAAFRWAAGQCDGRRWPVLPTDGKVSVDGQPLFQLAKPRFPERECMRESRVGQDKKGLKTVDIVYFLKSSKFDDIEMRFSLRSLAENYPEVGKVWILGDRPAFLSTDTSVVEHVPHQAIGDLVGIRSPIVNYFQLLFCASLLPELTPQFLCLSDDYVLLRKLSTSEASTVRYLEDLEQITNRGKGLWIDSLWRTYDTLKRLGYPVYNFETHTPTYFHKRWIVDAYRDFQGWITRDRWLGMLGITAVLNHALHHHRFDITPVMGTQVRAGFYGKPFTLEEIASKSRDHLFLSYDDGATNDSMLQFLRNRFPRPCRYEHADSVALPLDAAYFQTIAIRGT